MFGYILEGYSLTYAIDNNPYINGIGTSNQSVPGTWYRCGYMGDGLGHWADTTQLNCWAGYPMLPLKKSLPESRLRKSEQSWKKPQNSHVKHEWFFNFWIPILQYDLLILRNPMLSSVNHGFGPKIITSEADSAGVNWSDPWRFDVNRTTCFDGGIWIRIEHDFVISSVEKFNIDSNALFLAHCHKLLA
jgi:hypothetical protein